MKRNRELKTSYLSNETIKIEKNLKIEGPPNTQSVDMNLTFVLSV